MVSHIIANRFCLIIALHILAGCFMSPLEPVHHQKINQDKLNAETAVADETILSEKQTDSDEPTETTEKMTPEKNNETFSLIKEKSLENGELCQSSQKEPFMRILSKNEYLESVKNIFNLSGSLEQIEKLLPPGSTEQGFNFLRDFNLMSPEKLESYLNVGAYISGKVLEENLIQLNCGLSSTMCLRNWLEEKLPIIWRQKVTPEEIEGELNLFRSFGEDSEALKSLVQRYLISPKFIYRSVFLSVDLGSVTNWELVTLLSDTLWQGVLNNDLIDTANQSEPVSKDQLVLLIDQMLKNQNFINGLDVLAKGWLGLKEKNDPLTIPGFGDHSYESSAFYKAISYFLFDRIEEKNDSLSELLDSKYLWLPTELKEIYKVSDSEIEKKSSDKKYTRFEFTDDRGGLLSQPGFLISSSGSDHTNIPLRGKSILKNLLCHDLETPKDIVDVVSKVKFDINLPVSTAINQITMNGSCENCHKMINGVGSVFETLSPVGMPRLFDDHGKGFVQDKSIVFPDERVFQTETISDFNSELKADPSTGICLTVKVFRMFSGRMEKDQDACQISNIYKKASGDRGIDLKNLIVSMILSRSGY